MKATYIKLTTLALISSTIFISCETEEDFSNGNGPCDFTFSLTNEMNGTWLESERTYINDEYENDPALGLTDEQKERYQTYVQTITPYADQNNRYYVYDIHTYDHSNGDYYETEIRVYDCNNNIVQKDTDTQDHEALFDAIGVSYTSLSKGVSMGYFPEFD